MRGYTRSNLFRMRQFYEAYRGNEKVSPRVRQLPWTHHLIILGQAKPPETREFYILAAMQGAVDQARDRARDPVGRDPAECARREESVAGGGTNAPDGYRGVQERL
jgi:hypothetical protein